MAYIDYTPTPPDLKLGPFIDIALPQLSGTNVYRIYAGWWAGYAQHWSFVGANFTIVTDATVANRQIRIQQQNNKQGIYAVHQYLRTANVAASTTNTFLIGTNVIHTKGSADYAVDQALSILKDGMIIRGDNSFNIYIDTGKAGDTLNGWIRLRYMNRELGIPTPYDE